jgi:hypothetical protein
MTDHAVPSLPYSLVRRCRAKADGGTGAPPAYTTVIRRVYKGSMRGVLIFTAFLGMLWALVMGVEEIKDMSQSNGAYLLGFPKWAVCKREARP